MTTDTTHPSGSRRILMLMSGSIACAKATGLISAWAKQGHQVQVACTRSVSQFVGHATLEGFSGRRVHDDSFSPGDVMDHIHLAQWADLVIAVPATANLINRLSAGIADDAVTTLWQAAFGRKAPMLIVPAMNTHMWTYPATLESLQRLKSWGIDVLPTADGDLACGELGAGRMIEVEDILQRVEPLLAPVRQSTHPATGSTDAGKRILITAGGTREPIDAVRYIGNMSTGTTAARLTDTLSLAGHDVTWLGAESAVRPLKARQRETYVSFSDLQHQLKSLLASHRFDAVIHAAAVSDFSVGAINSKDESGPNGPAQDSKLASTGSLQLELVPNPKLLHSVRSWSANPDLCVIGFKLTQRADKETRRQAVERQFQLAGVDAVVHNDLSEISDNQHPFNWYSTPDSMTRCSGNAELGDQIDRLIRQHVMSSPGQEHQVK